MLKKKILDYIFLVFFLVVFCIGFINVIKAEEKATNIVMNTIEEDVNVIIVEEQIEKSIELGVKDYKRRGTYFLIISSIGIIQTFVKWKKD